MCTWLCKKIRETRTCSSGFLGGRGKAIKLLVVAAAASTSNRKSIVKKLVLVESSSEDESRKSDLGKSDKRLKIKEKQTESSSSDIERISTSTDLKKQRSLISRVSLHACIIPLSHTLHVFNRNIKRSMLKVDVDAEIVLQVKKLMIKHSTDQNK